MEWILVTDETPVPIDGNKTIIVEDRFGQMGQAFWDDERERWMLETFGRIDIAFDEDIIRFIEVSP